MVVDLKLCRFDNVPWGFRLVGGADFDYPLTVVKVNEGSIAEAAGLREGDIIVRINDIPTAPLPHEEINKIILSCGNVFFFGIYRENIEEENNLRFPVNEYERPISPYPEYEFQNRDSPSPIYETGFKEYVEENLKYENNLNNYRNDDQHQILPEIIEERPSSVLSENTEIKLVEEEIAAVLSGETEVLKEHQVLGIFPKPGVCMSSDVLRTLNDEATKTKAEEDQENRKWTTFLQRPDRPVPKSKQQLEAEQHAANKYKIQIIKNAPRTPERALSPAIEIIEEKSKEPTPEKSPEKPSTPIEPEVEEPPPTDSEVPNLVEEENAKTNDFDTQSANELNADEKSDKEKDINDDENEIKQDNSSAEEKFESETSSTSIETIVEKTEEELALERQLADVQKQLAALSTLPSTIQATLDAVTKQLAELLPTFKLQEQQQKATTTSSLPINDKNESTLEKINESTEEINEKVDEEIADKFNANNGDTTGIDLIAKNDGDILKNDDDDASESQDIDDAVNSFKQQETLQRKEETRQMEEELNLKKQKRSDVIEELEEHLERQKNPKRSKRAFGPLTPSSERPLVLPGGRRWYRPKDAYNDEFIAETLSAQAELITGTTLGVNFMKYQKPEKKIDLNRSEVYKVIHHLDRQPVRGIEIRPPVVAAEADIRNAVSS